MKWRVRVRKRAGTGRHGRQNGQMGFKLVLNGLKWSGNVRETVGKHPGYGPK